MNFFERTASEAVSIVEHLRSALENGTRVRIAGAQRWMDAGRPVVADDEIALAEHTGILEYVPGDLTMTVRAGTSLREIAATAAEHNQWLPLDPFGSDDGTIGATVATASGGPLAHAFGTPRDQVIGAGFVSGRGDYVRAGGRVVKNVAGFDLTRLVTGSWGTLGAITDVSLRLRAVPAVDLTLGLVISDTAVRFRQALDSVSGAHVAPLALELVNARIATALSAGADTMLLIRLAGNRAAVAAQRDVFAGFGEIRNLDMKIWKKLREIEPAGSAVVRYSGKLSEVGGLWRRGGGPHAAAAGGQPPRAPARALIHATIGRGIVRCIIPSSSDSVAFARILRELPPADESIACVFERLPPALWIELAPSTMNDPLHRRVKEAFDPAMLLNPGILGELPT
jgi:glycolate oxidase FAD binding subunit